MKYDSIDMMLDAIYVILLGVGGFAFIQLFIHSDFGKRFLIALTPEGIYFLGFLIVALILGWFIQYSRKVDKSSEARK